LPDSPELKSISDSDSDDSDLRKAILLSKKEGSPSSKSISDSDSDNSDLRKAILLSKESSGAGGSGSGTVYFVLKNLDELTIILPCLFGITSTILAINPEIFMYLRLIITLIREPAFKLYLYFKYLDLLCSIKEIKNISYLFCNFLFRLINTIFYFFYFIFRYLTTLFWDVSTSANTKRIG